MSALLLLSVLFVAFMNGANDNMKGAATLYGSGTLGYGRALLLATLSTACGSLASGWLASGLVSAFSARGLVPATALTTEFLAAVAAAAALTVFLATLLGLPISTTHALVGGLAGAGFVAAGAELKLAALGATFALPLLLGPLLAAPLAAGLYLAGRRARVGLGVESGLCVCADDGGLPVAHPSGVALRIGVPSGLVVGTLESCRGRYLGEVAGVPAQALADGLHIASGAWVGFARGLNDTPKLLGLLGGAAMLPLPTAALAITAAMALGGVLGARRVAETLARKVTEITPGQGLAANLGTSLLVTLASRVGLPVSTTHVSTGGIFGIGATHGALRWGTVGAIILAWLTTLPLSAAVAALLMVALR